MLLNEKAIAVAEQIQNIDSKSAKWIASDAIRELKDKNIVKRLYAKKNELDKLRKKRVVKQKSGKKSYKSKKCHR